MEDFYKILGISSDATSEEIKKAFRGLAKKHHPDVGGSVEEFEAIERAREVLLDVVLRAAYDRGEDIDSIETPKEEAANNLCHIFDLVVGSPTFMADHSKLMALIRAEINEKTLSMHDDIEKCEMDIRKFNSLNRRIKNCDILKAYTSFKIVSMEGRIEEIKAKISIQEIMLNMLETAQYESVLDYEEVEYEQEASKESQEV